MLKLNRTFKKACRMALLLTVTIAAGVLYSCKNRETLSVTYDLTFEQLAEQAKKEDKAFCIILSRPDCPPCASYVRRLADNYKHLAAKVTFNVVDVTLPENQWYPQWLCTGASPVTCVFSAKGELTAVVSGATASCTQCIESAVKGDNKCAAYFYKHPSLKGNTLAVLNTVLACKQQFDKGKDISNDILSCLGPDTYPYPLYLQCLNEEQHGRHEQAVQWAQQLLTFNNLLYARVYSGLYAQVKPIINPDYTADSDAVLFIADEVPLGNCRLHQPVPFSLALSNTGKATLNIHDINPGCSCVKLLSRKTLTLRPGESQKVDLVFTPDVAGDIYREVTLVSDAANALKRIKITAVVK